MEDGQHAAICGYLEHAGLKILSYIYEIPEIYITKKLQKLQAVKWQATCITRNRFKMHDRLVKRNEADRVSIECTNEKKDFIH